MIRKQRRFFSSSERGAVHRLSPSLPTYKTLLNYSVNTESRILDKYLLALL
jgi:hypothetical protein